MAAYAQFGYGNYPSSTQLLSSNVAQSVQTAGGDTSMPPSTAPNAPPPLSPSSECRANPAAPSATSVDVPSGALSPDALSQTSNTTGAGGPLSNPPGGPLEALGAHAASAGGGGSCCENGRPIMTDPVSGQTVCSCQYDSARLALSSYSRLPAASVGVYGTPYPSTDQNPYQSIGVDSSAFYSPLSNPYALKESAAGSDMTAWTSAGLQPTTGYYSYDPMSAYGYGASYDLAARRKNATRESTATLKAWLNEHKKNPYPTKGEKIMLAIITKMTLTQVSTWFANARRRLKKENKMTWEPKNRTDDDDEALVSDDEKEKDEGESDKAGQGGNTGQRKDADKDDDELNDEEQKPLAHPNDLHSGSNLGFSGAGYHSGNHPHSYHPYHHQHPAYYQHQQALLAASYHPSSGPNNGNSNSNNKHDSGSESKNQLSRDCGVPIPATKPKIWSLADTVACKTPPPAVTAAAYMGQQQQQQQHPQQYMGRHMSSQQQQQQQQQHMTAPLQQQQQPPPNAMMSSGYGAMPYSRAPTTAYANFLGTTTQQLYTMNNNNNANSSNNNTPYNNNNNSHMLNHNSNSNAHIMPPTTPTTAAANAPMAHQSQQHQQPPPLPPPLRQSNVHHPYAATQRGMGFPEAQPDTPPQTPPNMKLQSVAANLLHTALQIPTTGTCRSNNNNSGPGIGSIGYAMNYSTRFGAYSPRDESSSGGSSCSSAGSPRLQQNEPNFKATFKSQQMPVANFVSAV